MTVIVRSDPVSRAGAGVRAVGRNDRRSNRDRLTIYGIITAAAIAWIVAVAQWVWGEPWDGLTIGVLAAIAASAATFVFAMRGTVAAILIAGLAAAVTVWAGWSTLHWLVVLCGAVIPMIAVLGVYTARRERLTRMSAAAVVAALTPLVYGLAGSVLGPWVIVVDAAITGAAVMWQIDLPRRAVVRAASKRSHIPLMASGPFTASRLFVSGPSGVDARTISQRSEAAVMTAELLTQLPPSWFVFHSRLTQSGESVDHIVVGPAGVIVLRSEIVEATLLQAPASVNEQSTSMQVDMDGDRLDDQWATALCWAAVDVDTALMTPGGMRVTTPIYVLHNAHVEDGVVSQTVTVKGRPDNVDYVAAAHLVDTILQLPTRRVADPEDPQFVEDLAVIVDYLFPPER